MSEARGARTQTGRYNNETLMRLRVPRHQVGSPNQSIIQKLLRVTHRITPVEPRHHSTTIRTTIRRLPFRGTSQNHADSVQRDERGDDEKDRRPPPGCPTRATTTTTITGNPNPNGG